MTNPPAPRATPDPTLEDPRSCYYVCITTPEEAMRDRVASMVPAHKAWTAEREAAGDFLIAGPFVDEEGRYAGSGLMVIRARNRAEAQAIADSDPMHSHGVRAYTLQRWRVHEGSLDLRLVFSALWDSDAHL